MASVSKPINAIIGSNVVPTIKPMMLYTVIIETINAQWILYSPSFAICVITSSSGFFVTEPSLFISKSIDSLDTKGLLISPIASSIFSSFSLFNSFSSLTSKASSSKNFERSIPPLKLNSFSLRKRSESPFSDLLILGGENNLA